MSKENPIKSTGKRGGARPGAGRPRGAETRRTRLLAEAAKAEGISPLEYMLKIMRDESKPEAVRFDAARAAASYCHPKLQSLAVSGVTAPPAPSPIAMSPEALAALVKKLNQEI